MIKNKHVADNWYGRIQARPHGTLRTVAGECAAFIAPQQEGFRAATPSDVGNHVGDWEHTMIRFEHGKPTSVFLSEHDFGAAYAFHAGYY